MTVYVVQELKRNHCPKCGWSKINWLPAGSDYRFECANWNCKHQWNAENMSPTIDLTPAMKYGEIEVLIEANTMGIAIQPLISVLRSRLAKFTDDDYILPVGDPVAIGAVTAIAAEVNRGQLKMLRWDRRMKQYTELKFNIRGKSFVDTERKTA